MRLGVCLVPFGNPGFDHGWLPPKPSGAGWLALRAIGFTDVRLQFNIGGDRTVFEAPVSEHPGDWDTSLFRAFITPAFDAGMKINANYCVAAPVPAHQTAAFHEFAAERFAREFGHMIDSYSFGNEPGADAQKYEDVEIPPPDGGGEFSHRDYMRNVYFPTLCLPFVRGIRRAVPNAWILGCDADSADIQRRYIQIADELAQTINICDEEGVHPYYHVNRELDYASLDGANGKPGFLTGRTTSSRPWGITEIDDSDDGNPFGFLTDVANGKYPGCTRYYELFQNTEQRWFAAGTNAVGLPCSSFYTSKPVVNENGKRYVELFAKVNGPVDPIRKTMPIPRHRAVKPT